jgi:sulfate transport system permease protein
MSLGITMAYLGVIVCIPLALLFVKTATADWQDIWSIVTNERVLKSFEVSLTTSLYAAAINGLLGFAIAWVLTRYAFWGRSFVDALIDLPFALPTAVAGIALTALYAPDGWVGRLFDEGGFFARLLGQTVQIAYTPLGITLALLFIGMPFVVRTLQPVILDLESDVEEAATTLGASRWHVFWRVIFPALVPAWLTGMTLAFARGLGEYGSVVFISANLPYRTEIVPLLIYTKLEEYDYVGASVIAVAMLLVSFALLLVLNVLQWVTRKRMQSV